MLNEQIDHIFTLQKNYKFKAKKTSAKYRIEKLEKAKEVIIKLQPKIEQAMVKDFGKAPLESDLTEILPLLTMIDLYKKKLKAWMKPKKVSSSLLFLGTKNYVSYEAKGNCLVISPWNYPFQLSLYPVLTAFSAGNTVILKPSEYTPETNKVVEEIIIKVFLPEEVSVVHGAVEASNLLLEKAFDHIFFTGSTPVGKIIMEKASKHLASVSLELGGKSPVVIDKSFSLKEAARNIAWGKLVNAGQTCVAPDYIMLPKGEKDKFAKYYEQALKHMYGKNISGSNDFCRIITKRHLERQEELIADALSKGAKLDLGEKDSEHGKLSPCLISGVDKNMKLMQEEIFGPILPIIEYDDIDEALDYINEYDNALALYVFSHDKNNIETIRKKTNSGGLSINETLLHVGHANLPFGGAGKSGLGKYHGHFGFEEMSNLRSVLHRKFSSGTQYFYPPYKQNKKSRIDKVIRYLTRFL